MNKQEIIDRLKAILMNTGRSSLMDKGELVNLIEEIEADETQKQMKGGK